MRHINSNNTTELSNGSPFHYGEQALHRQLGIAEKMENIGQRMIRSFMPEQHREFYQQLPFILVGHADQQGQAWASILFNETGFISSPNNTSLIINATAILGDPLGLVKIGDKLGLLGIELQSRRRNRLSVQISNKTAQGFAITVLQSFGNCPQYIKKRKLIKNQHNGKTQPQYLKVLDQAAINLIKKSDTFFVASYFNDTKQPKHNSNGADVSHRGGDPGFIRVENNACLTIPDYQGNNIFNTLGNISANGKAGLLFIDFKHGDILTLTGEGEILPESDDLHLFSNAQRLWRFTIKQGIWLPNAIPYRWQNNDIY